MTSSLVVVVVEALSPAAGRFSLQERQQALSLHLRARLGSGQVEKSLSEVQVTGEVAVSRLGPYGSGPADQEGHAVGKFVHPALVEPAVIPQVKTLVGCVDDHRILGQSALIKVLEQSAYVLIHRLGAQQVVADPSLVVPAGQFLLVHGSPLGEEGLVARAEVAVEDLELLGGEFTGILEHQTGIAQVLEDAHLVFAGRGRAPRVIVEEGLGLGDFEVVQSPQVTQGRFPASVRGLVLAHQHEGFVRVALLLEPLQAEVRDDVRGIAHVLDLLAVLLHARVVVGPLTVEHLIAVEARGVRLEVPFSDKGGLVARLAQELGESYLGAVEDVSVGHLPVVEGMPAG